MLLGRKVSSSVLYSALSVGLSVLLAMFVNYELSYSKEYWIVLAAFLICQTTQGTPLRQAMIYGLISIAAIILAGILRIYNLPVLVSSIVIAIIYITSAYLIVLKRPTLNRTLLLIMLFVIMMIIAYYTPIKTMQFMRYRIIDIVIGIATGILVSQILFPMKLEKAFREGITPILQSLTDFSPSMIQFFLFETNDVNLLRRKKSHVEFILETHQGLYPEWVYEPGFNPGLRSGFRFFLINIERVIEIYFSMYRLNRETLDMETIKLITPAIKASMFKNEELLRVLIQYFNHNKLEDIHADFTTDITELEEALQKIVPNNVELLDLAPQYVTLTALAREIKDLRRLLLHLATSLWHPV